MFRCGLSVVYYNLQCFFDVTMFELVLILLAGLGVQAQDESKFFRFQEQHTCVAMHKDFVEVRTMKSIEHCLKAFFMCNIRILHRRCNLDQLKH